jgi:hypothetical protein
MKPCRYHAKVPPPTPRADHRESGTGKNRSPGRSFPSERRHQPSSRQLRRHLPNISGERTFSATRKALQPRDPQPDGPPSNWPSGHDLSVEIGDMSPSLQVMFLPSFRKNNRKHRRRENINADVRIIAATNQNLKRGGRKKIP